MQAANQIFFSLLALMLVGLYLAFIAAVAIFKPDWVPALPAEARIYTEPDGSSGHRSLLVLLLICGVAAYLWSQAHESIINPLIEREMPASHRHGFVDPAVEHQRAGERRRTPRLDRRDADLTALDLRHQPALRQARQLVRDHAPVVDGRRGAGVGGAQHGPPQLQRAQARDLQVLVDGDGVAEPADVAQVDEHRGRRGRVGERVHTLATLLVAQAMEGGDSPEVVAEVVVKAALATTPKRRYTAGKAAGQLKFLRRFAPTSVLDKGLRKTLQLDTGDDGV